MSAYFIIVSAHGLVVYICSAVEKAQMKKSLSVSWLPFIFICTKCGTFTFAIHQNEAIKNMYEFWTGPASADLFMNISVWLKTIMYHIEFCMCAIAVHWFLECLCEWLSARSTRLQWMYTWKVRAKCGNLGMWNGRQCCETVKNFLTDFPTGHFRFGVIFHLI